MVVTVVPFNYYIIASLYNLFFLLLDFTAISTPMASMYSISALISTGIYWFLTRISASVTPDIL
jgi:hypothetical protein